MSTLYPPGTLHATVLEPDYVRPESLHEALEWMRNKDTVVLAGGTDLVTMRASGMARPQHLVDVKRLKELRVITESETELAIGAAVTMEQVAGLSIARAGAIVDGARVIGAPQTRARATIGGNVCRSSPAGDTLAGLLVLDAQIDLASLDHERSLPISSFFTGPGQNVRDPDELAVRVRLPLTEGGSAYVRQTYRSWLDLAVTGVAARIAIGDNGVCADAAIAIAAMAPTPILVPGAASALIGSRCDAAALAAAGAAVRAAVDPIDDVRGTRSYRMRIVSALLNRVVTRAVQRGSAQ